MTLATISVSLIGAYDHDSSLFEAGARGFGLGAEIDSVYAGFLVPSWTVPAAIRM